METNRLSQIMIEFRRQLKTVRTRTELNDLRLKYLGRKGVFNELTKKVSQLPAGQRAKFGQELNRSKAKVSSELEMFAQEINQRGYRQLDQEWFDVTQPGIKPQFGHLHPQTLVLQDIIQVFKNMGYQLAMGPEIESDEYNFAKLNFPPEHPARDAQATLYLDTQGTNLTPGSVILRTHTSAMQARIMEQTKPPLRIVVPGKCYRHDTVDASHGFEFGQVEGFVVDKNVSLANLFGTLESSLKLILGPEIKVRFACTYFPFVEPGVDTYIQCTLCQGSGCPFCKQTGWSEIMPAGMIHPNVFKAVGYPKKTQGFAFAIGLSRVANLKYGIDDLRVLSTPDLRILTQF